MLQNQVAATFRTCHGERLAVAVSLSCSYILFVLLFDALLAGVNPVFINLVANEMNLLVS